MDKSMLKKAIEERIKDLEDELNKSKKRMADDNNLGAELVENANVQIYALVSNKIINKWSNLLILLGEALFRLDHEDSFGVCVDCEEEIKKSRLLVQPMAKRCLNCQIEHETVEAMKKKKSGGYTEII